ncbi:hypothetical protein BX661DRAFT_176460 [Kickxella alabastrina]|uniref:uncharacterized protein n=1 Tax=Kickxella alabastrina TaxID=61397 RepID=UPI00221EEDCE|nr:uncharacterized protein BX661DRAFT_176460 [Kickxella alabastrina]KAI7834004.1 hypothetical protein BX661DRAFT_176460 [Kickxella alabastrina]
MYFKLASIIALVGLSTAHLDMISPCPRYSPHGLDCPALPAGQSLDYSMSSPLSGGDPLCKHTTPYPTASATWTAGQPVTVKLAPGGAPHGGGHCQFSLSYDGGQNFVVVHEVLQQCFGSDQSQRDFTFTLPGELPGSEKAVFAWSWVNAVGNREFYMNCADVRIVGGGSESFTGKRMVVANLPGYPTVPEFNGNYAVGMELYTGAPKLTVTGIAVAMAGNYPVPHIPSPSSSPSYISPSALPTYLAVTEKKHIPVSSAPMIPSVTAATSKTSVAVTDIAYPVNIETPSAHPYTQEPPFHYYSTRAVSLIEITPSMIVTVLTPDTEATVEPTYYASLEPITKVAVGVCSEESMRCSADGKGYQYCLYGEWTVARPCPKSTVCKPLDNSIVCDWP